MNRFNINQNNNDYYVYGKNPVKERLKIVKNGILFIKKNIQQAKIKDVIDKAKLKNIEINFLESDSFEKKFHDFNHQGIVLKISDEYSNYISEKEFIDYLNNLTIKKSTLLILDGIQDVGNLGAVLRSALLFNIDGVILPKDNSAPINSIVEKRSSGASAYLKILYATNLVRIMEILKTLGYWIYGADKAGQNLETTEFNDKSVIVIGQESSGIRHLVKKNCDMLILIPTNEKIDSLNLSVSAGIILYSRYIQNIIK